jgi:hypothetical protein
MILSEIIVSIQYAYHLSSIVFASNCAGIVICIDLFHRFNIYQYSVRTNFCLNIS